MVNQTVQKDGLPIRFSKWDARLLEVTMGFYWPRHVRSPKGDEGLGNLRVLRTMIGLIDGNSSKDGYSFSGASVIEHRLI